MNRLYFTPDKVGVGVGVDRGASVEVGVGVGVGVVPSAGVDVGVGVGAHIDGVPEGALNVPAGSSNSINEILVLAPPVEIFCEEAVRVPLSEFELPVQSLTLYLYDPAIPETFKSIALDGVTNPFAEALFIYPSETLVAVIVNWSKSLDGL